MCDISSTDSVRQQMSIAADSVDKELFKALKEEFDKDNRTEFDMEKSPDNEEAGVTYIPNPHTGIDLDQKPVTWHSRRS